MEELITIMPKKYSKLLKTWEEVKSTTLNCCTNQVIINILTLIDLDRFSFYFKLINGDISINAIKLSIKEFKNEIDSLRKRKQKKSRTKKIKKMS